MDKDPNDIILEQSLTTILSELPPPLSTYLTRREHSVAASRFIGKYKLDHDQGYILERELMLLVMTINQVAEVEHNLAIEARIDKPVVQHIMLDIVESILKPLLKQIDDWEKGRALEPLHAVDKKQTPSVPIAKPKQAQVPLPSYAGAPPLQSPRYIRDDAKVPEAFIAHAPQGATMPRQAITLGVERPSAQAPQAPAPVAQEVQRPVPVPAPMPMPKPVPPPQPVPQRAPAQAVSAPEHRAELPIGEAEPQRQAQPIRPLHAAIPTPPPAPTPPPQAPKPSYSADPYREPLDEKGA